MMHLSPKGPHYISLLKQIFNERKDELSFDQLILYLQIQKKHLMLEDLDIESKILEIAPKIDLKNSSFDIQDFSPEGQEKIYSLLEREMKTFYDIDAYILLFQRFFLESSEERFLTHLEVLENVFHLMQHHRRTFVLFLFKRLQQTGQIRVPGLLKTLLGEMDFREF